ncbi:MAG: DUF2934 domain-containing protein [Candidatus Obscuribacterales bacterium]|nr:DUF2934 domain-containing protein [Candidatus Obscuribacterales bacterium]
MNTKTKQTGKSLDSKKREDSGAEKHSTPVSSELVSFKAYALWQRRGCSHGFDFEDWLEAERILQEESLQLKGS